MDNVTDAPRLRSIRRMTLLFVLPGLIGLLISAGMSTWYLEELPRVPVPAEMRMTPRSVEGFVVYETPEEHRTFTAIEHASTAFFVVGIGLGLVYLRRWGVAYALSAKDDEYAQDAP